MRDALLGLAFAAQADEGFALEIEHVLLRDELRRGDGAAGENVCQFAAYYAVMLRSVAAANHPVDGQLRAGEEFFAEHTNLRGGRRMVPGAQECERGLLSVGNLAIAIHGDEIGGAHIAESARFLAAG